ncbi:MAG: aminomethyltransferase family protein [Chloroflexota bacterium]
MIKRTPFYPRQVELNETLLWEDWAGYAAPSQYQYATVVEYFATRNGAALYDTSPLFKYRIKGKDATKFLAGVLARDIRRCPVGSAQYTIWCNDAGFVLEDGVVMHVHEDEYLLAAAEPNLKYFSDLVGRMAVEIEDISEEYGILAVQGPHALSVLGQLTADAEKLGYFGVMETAVSTATGTIPTIISRTGYTGDLGYEIWMKAEDGLAVWDALMEAGSGYNLTPIGMTALTMARLDAGMLMIDIDFSTARHAWVDAQRETPLELGLNWMLRGIEDEERPFIGRRAILQEKANKTSRWRTVGLEFDTVAYEKIHNDQGIIAPKAGVLNLHTMYLYDDDFNQNINSQYLGYITSMMFSPFLKKHIAIAKLPTSHAKRGSKVYVELEVLHRSHYFPATVVRMPFYNPTRKTK